MLQLELGLQKCLRFSLELDIYIYIYINKMLQLDLVLWIVCEQNVKIMARHVNEMLGLELGLWHYVNVCTIHCIQRQICEHNV